MHLKWSEITAQWVQRETLEWVRVSGLHRPTSCGPLQLDNRTVDTDSRLQGEAYTAADVQTLGITECKIKAGQELKLSTFLMWEREGGIYSVSEEEWMGFAPSERERECDMLECVCISLHYAHVYNVYTHTHIYVCIRIGAVCTWKPKVDRYLVHWGRMSQWNLELTSAVGLVS